jgi:hypothetical protein
MAPPQILRQSRTSAHGRRRAADSGDLTSFVDLCVETRSGLACAATSRLTGVSSAPQATRRSAHGRRRAADSDDLTSFVDLCVETRSGCGLRSNEPRDWCQLDTSGNAPVRTTSAAMSCSLRLLCWLVRFST